MDSLPQYCSKAADCNPAGTAEAYLRDTRSSDLGSGLAGVKQRRKGLPSRVLRGKKRSHTTKECRPRSSWIMFALRIHEIMKNLCSQCYIVLPTSDYSQRSHVAVEPLAVPSGLKTAPDSGTKDFLEVEESGHGKEQQPMT